MAEKLESTKKILSQLAQDEMDAAFIYEHALRRVGEESIKTDLRIFFEEHKRHFRDLSSLLVKLGGYAPKHGKDIKGLLKEGYTIFKSLFGIEGLLKALKANEESTIRTYEDSSKADLLREARELVRENLEDEHRHIEFINTILSRIRKNRRL